MDIRFRDNQPDRIKTDLLVLPVSDNKLTDPRLRALDRRLKGRLSAHIAKSRFTGAEGSTLPVCGGYIARL